MCFTSSFSQITFEKKLIFSTDAAGSSIVQTSEGSFYICGRILENKVFSRPFLGKTDGIGNIIWVEALDSLYSESGFDATSMISTSDGGVGITTTFEFSNFLTQFSKFDKYGVLEWTSLFNGALGMSAVETVDSNYVLASCFLHNNSHSVITKISHSGEILWSKSLVGRDGVSGLVATSSGAVITQDGSVVIAGSDMGVKISKISSSGHILWLSYDSLHADVKVSAMIKTHDQGFAICGGSQGDMIIVKFDSNGLLLWNKAIDLFGKEEATGIAERANGDLIVSGTFSTNDSLTTSNTVFIATLNEMGDFHTVKLLKIPHTNSEGIAIIKTQNDGVAIVGSIVDTLNRKCVFFMRLDTALEECYLENSLASSRNIGSPGDRIFGEKAVESFRDTRFKVTINSLGYKEINLCSIFSVAKSSETTPTLAISPNPVHLDKTVLIHLNRGIPGSLYELRVTDLLGNILIKKTINQEGGPMDFPLNVSRLAAGMYLVELLNLSNNNEIYHAKFVKED